MNKKQVFISYKSEERDQALWTRTVLEENGISCWMDTDVPAGANYAEEINKALINASAIVLIMSKKSQTSEHVKNEIDLAAKHSKFIIAFVIEECDMVAGFDFDLPAEQRYDAFIDRAEAVDKMVLSLKSVIEAREADSYELMKFLKERRRYLREKKQREAMLKERKKKEEPPKMPADKKVIKRFPMCWTPYALNYFTAPNPRLALNIHTFSVVLMSLGLTVLVLAALVSSSPSSIFVLFIPLIVGVVFFIVGEAIAGGVCYFIGKIKSRVLLVITSLVTAYLMGYVILGIFMLLLRVL